MNEFLGCQSSPVCLVLWLAAGFCRRPAEKPWGQMIAPEQYKSILSWTTSPVTHLSIVHWRHGLQQKRSLRPCLIKTPTKELHPNSPEPKQTPPNQVCSYRYLYTFLFSLTFFFRGGSLLVLCRALSAEPPRGGHCSCKGLLLHWTPHPWLLKLFHPHRPPVPNTPEAQCAPLFFRRHQRDAPVQPGRAARRDSWKHARSIPEFSGRPRRSCHRTIWNNSAVYGWFIGKTYTLQQQTLK